MFMLQYGYYTIALVPFQRDFKISNGLFPQGRIAFPETETLSILSNQNGGKSMILDKAALTLAVIGALNWGGIGLFGFDTVAFLCGGQLSLLARIIYTLVGLAGLWCITLLFRPDTESGHSPHTA